MKTFQEADFKQAARTFAIANTPLFLIRKLRQDPIVREISKSLSDEETIKRIRYHFAKAPETVLDFAIPYAYLIALSLKESDRGLREAAAIDAPCQWTWWEYIGKVLVATYSPTAQVDIRVPGQLDTYLVLNRSDAPVKEQKIVLVQG